MTSWAAGELRQSCMRFSERHGYRQVKTALQVESMDDDLRSGLWSALKTTLWTGAHFVHGISPGYFLEDPLNRQLKRISHALWLDYFKSPVDELPSRWDEAEGFFRNYFFKSLWHEAYDFIEFVAARWPAEDAAAEFRNAYNRVLEREVAGYRFVGDQMTPIIDKVEVEAIEDAVETADEAVAAHLSRAIELLSDRQQPDYRNSMKESISAVEAAVRAHTGSTKGTLGELLDGLDLHPALERSMSNLYGYTSDANGIRHALQDADNSSFAEAKYMLVVCAAFVNYVKSRTTTNKE